jgi:predicted transcriptional regulator
MGNKRELWDFLYQTVGTAFGVIPRINAVAQDSDITTGQEWGCLNWAASLAPTPLNPERLPTGYNAPGRFVEAAKRLVDLGYLEAANEKSYRPTQRGMDIIDHIEAVQVKAFNEHEPLAEAELDRFLTLMDKVLKGIKSLAQPPRPRFEIRSTIQIVRDLTPLWMLMDKVILIENFRQDSHAASWKSHDINPHAWEILTLLWREEATGIDDLPELVANNRGFTREETETAFKDLVERGWIGPAAESGKYQVTVSGKTIRQEAEDLTDKYFFAAWDGLGESELQEIRTLTTKVQAYFAERQQPAA